MSGISHPERAVLTALAQGENAQELSELAYHTEMPPEQIAPIIDGLVERGILRADTSYHRSEIGCIVYFYNWTDEAQEVYERIVPEEE